MLCLVVYGFDYVDTFDGRPSDISVTQLVSKFFKSFDADEVISRMMNGRNWPNPTYTHPNGHPYTSDEIRSKWNGMGLVGKNRGVWLHHNIERYFNRLPYANDNPEMVQFQHFVDEHIIKANVKPYRTEWRICGERDEFIAGTVDFIGQLPDGTYALYDWKGLKDVDATLSNMYGNRAM